jgi:hypothetical protein
LWQERRDLRETSVSGATRIRTTTSKESRSSVRDPTLKGQIRRQSTACSQETLQRVFADLGPRSGGRSYDLEVINNTVIRQILGSLSTLAETEYIAGYYPGAVDEELTAHTVEVSLVSEEIGKLYGGRRLVVH